MSVASRRVPEPHNCSRTFVRWVDGWKHLKEGEGWVGLTLGKSRDGFENVLFALLTST